MNYKLLLLAIILSFVMSFPFAYGQSVDLIDNSQILQSGIISTKTNNYTVSNELDVREFFDGKIIRISGLTTDGNFFYTYSKIVEDTIKTSGKIFLDGFVPLVFDQVMNQTSDEVIKQKNDDLLILIRYPDRVFWKEYVQLDIRVYDKSQNTQNDFNQNYGFLSKVSVKITVMDKQGDLFASMQGTTTDKGFFEDKFYIPERTNPDTFTITIDAENKDSKSSQMIFVHNFGEEPDDGSTSTP